MHTPPPIGSLYCIHITTTHQAGQDISRNEHIEHVVPPRGRDQTG